MFLRKINNKYYQGNENYTAELLLLLSCSKNEKILEQISGYDNINFKKINEKVSKKGHNTPYADDKIYF